MNDFLHTRIFILNWPIYPEKKTFSIKIDFASYKIIEESML